MKFEVGNWTVDTDRLVALPKPALWYEIDLENERTCDDIFRFIAHVARKDWATSEMVGDLLTIFSAARASPVYDDYSSTLSATSLRRNLINFAIDLRCDSHVPCRHSDAAKKKVHICVKTISEGARHYERERARGRREMKAKGEL